MPDLPYQAPSPRWFHPRVSALQPERSGLRWGRGVGEGRMDHHGAGVDGLPPTALCAHLARRRGSKGTGISANERQRQGLFWEPIQVLCGGARPGDARLPLGLDLSQGGRLFSQARQSDRGAWPSWGSQQTHLSRREVRRTPPGEVLGEHPPARRGWRPHNPFTPSTSAMCKTQQDLCVINISGAGI